MVFALWVRDAAADAARKTNIELWTLYGIGVAFTILRTYSRIRAVGLRNLRLDDYLIWIGIIFYTAQTALAYNVGAVANGLANNSMTDAQRTALSPSSSEYSARVTGSKIQIAGWSTYVALINSLKLSMLAFYLRLMEGLGRRYQIPIYVGLALITASFIASMVAILASCRPFHKNWQINPDPGNVCQPAISKPVIAVTFAANLLTDPYLIFIPIPMLWKSSLKVIKKIATTIVLSAGIFILVCATLKSVFLLVDPENGATVANEWGTRETFVAVITTNLPMVFHLFRTWLTRVFGSKFGSSHKTNYKTPSASGGLHTISGRGNFASRKGRSDMDPITIGMTFTESEERMMEDEIKMQNIRHNVTHIQSTDNGTPSSSGIMVSNQVDVTNESVSRTSDGARSVREVW
ncbi:hypothetical protein N7509_001391 [Penicillium cosmopolitanum]|uniref:Rhodopsin domain-containing protein n=1 Tax=Penicillium cosmopolitanum TaxID=1131564 RepID=A0A9W9WCN9_9EURO|nr:uncharacterized protein N7509_001391 [Penicillium cosmopolitanum]KAJ5414764.1 hypothetical protein N7509_001391 [Penicillium cosmopolitanum]